MAEMDIQTPATATRVNKDNADSLLAASIPHMHHSPAVLNVNLQHRSFHSLTTPPASPSSLSIMSLPVDNVYPTPGLHYASSRRISGQYGPARPRSRGSPASSPLAGPAISSRSSSPTPSDDDEKSGTKSENVGDNGKGKDKVVYRPNRISDVPSFRMSVIAPDEEPSRPPMRRPASMTGYFDGASLDTLTPGSSSSLRRPNTSTSLRRPHSVTFGAATTILEEEPSSESQEASTQPPSFKSAPSTIRRSTNQSWLLATPTPAFTRSALPLQNVVMPVRAPRKRKSTLEASAPMPSSKEGETSKPISNLKSQLKQSGNSIPTKLEVDATFRADDSSLVSKIISPKTQKSDSPSLTKSQSSKSLLSRVKTARTKSLPLLSSAGATDTSASSGEPSKTDDDDLKRKRSRSLKSFSSRELLSKIKLPGVNNASVNDATPKNYERKEVIGAGVGIGVGADVAAIADNAETALKDIKNADLNDGTVVTESVQVDVNFNTQRKEAQDQNQKRRSIIDPAFFADLFPFPSTMSSTKAHNDISDLTKLDSTISAVHVTNNPPRKSQDSTREISQKTKSSPDENTIPVEINSKRGRSRTTQSNKSKPLRPTKSLNFFFVHNKQSDVKDFDEKDDKYNCAADSAAVEVHIIPTHNSNRSFRNASSTSSSSSTLSSDPALNSILYREEKIDKHTSFSRSKSMPRWASKLFSRIK